MAIEFSDTVNGDGIVQQVRNLTRIDSSQWPTVRIANSVNNYLDTVAGYAIGADKRFQWDDTNHTKLPIGTTNLVANQSDYSFLVDEQGNSIITLTRVDILTSSGSYFELNRINLDEIPYAVDAYSAVAGVPQEYDKISDNIVRLFPKPDTSVTDGLKFYFQRTPSYFTASDTTKTPGVSPLLHRGFVISAAYDCAAALGLQNLQTLALERQVEEDKMIRYFTDRNNDERFIMTGTPFNFR